MQKKGEIVRHFYLFTAVIFAASLAFQVIPAQSRPIGVGTSNQLPKAQESDRAELTRQREEAKKEAESAQKAANPSSKSDHQDADESKKKQKNKLMKGAPPAGGGLPTDE
jgi:hypothetical protein